MHLGIRAHGKMHDRIFVLAASLLALAMAVVFVLAVMSYT
jgi:hypothetical protein